MTMTRAAAAIVAWLATCSPVVAQQAEPPAPAGMPARPSPPRLLARTPTADLDVSRLPVDLDRIQKALEPATVREERDGLNLRYMVDVYGQAPALQLFSEDANLQYGPVPYGGPTHKDMLEVMTPREYRPPVADFSALLRWLASKTSR